jgi:hypothetical protein
MFLVLGDGRGVDGEAAGDGRGLFGAAPSARCEGGRGFECCDGAVGCACVAAEGAFVVAGCDALPFERVGLTGDMELAGSE